MTHTIRIVMDGQPDYYVGRQDLAKGYETLSMQDRIDIIAQSFGCTSGKIETSPCTGKWRGTSDISIKFDNDTSLFIGNHRTPQAKTQKVQNEYVNSALVRYNPEIIMATKEAAIDVLRKRETKDNEIAAQKGLKPYTLLNVELNDGTDEKSGGHMGWYYVTLAVGGEIHAHIETGLNYAIADGKVSETPTRENYFVAGALKESDVDYVFNNTGFSSTSDLYSLPVREDVRERAEKTLAERTEAQQKAPKTKTIYYTINEGAARRANDANSYYDYKPGSATAEYRSMVDKAVEIAENQKKRVDPMYHEKIDSLVDTYARKLAENMNSSFSIEARVPSMVTGNLYELDYQKHYEHVKDASVPAGDTKLIYENGERTQEAGKRITGDASPDLGKFVNFEEQPKDPAALRGVLWDEKYSRDHFDCGNIKEHIETLSGKGKEKKPSLRKQLAQDKETVKAAPKKQATKSKNKGLEV